MTHIRQRLLATLVAPALALTLGSAASAQDSQSAAKHQAQRATTTTQPAAATDRYARATRLIGADVRGPSGETMGEIKDLIVDPRDGTIRYAVLEFGGFMGMGEKLRAVPMSSVTPSAYGRAFDLKIDRARLQSAPAFLAKDWPDFSRASVTEIDRYYGTSMPAPYAQLRRASELIGADVDDRNGTDIGHLEDIVVNTTGGKVEYAVVEVDRLGDFPDRLIQVPLQSLKSTADRDTLMMNADAQSVERREGFDRRNWPDINDPAYRTAARGYVTGGPWSSWYEARPVGTPPSASTTDPFRALDRNNDGVLSREEFASYRISRQ